MQITIGIAATLLSTCISLPSQVNSSASSGDGQKLAAGAGLSIVYPDYGHGKLQGGTLWLDYSPFESSSIVRGIGFEVEARDIHFLRSANERVLREDVALAGVTYTVNRFPKVAPYIKAEWGFGNLDYLVSATRSYHQTRTVTALGGGMDWNAFQGVWFRAEYEYEIYPDFFLGIPEKPTSGSANPQGFTFGVMYRLQSRNSRF